MLLAGCGSDAAGTKVAQEALDVRSPAPPPSPPPPVVAPVAGTVETILDDSSWNDQLGIEDDGAPAEGSVEAATQAVAAALDQFLDGAQVGQPDLAAIGAAWLAEADPEAAAVLQQQLTNPDNPVDAVSYLMRVLLEPNPAVVATNVQVRRHDGTSVKVELVFDVTGEQPALDLVGGAEVLS